MDHIGLLLTLNEMSSVGGFELTFLKIHSGCCVRIGCKGTRVETGRPDREYGNDFSKRC